MTHQEHQPQCPPFHLDSVELVETAPPAKNIREPPDCTGNEPTPDIHIGGSGQDIKNKMADTCHV